MDQQKRKFYIPYFLTLLLLIISCKTNQKTAEVVFWCVDQYGQPVIEAQIDINNKQRKTNNEGKCVLTLSSENQKHHLIAAKEGLVFLGPDEIYVESGKDIEYVINFLRNYKISIRTWKRSWNIDVQDYNEREPYKGIEIIIGDVEKKETDNEGRLELNLDSEIGFSVKIAARSSDGNLINQKRDTTFSLTQDNFEYFVEFEFKDKQRRKQKGDEPPPPLEPAKLVILTTKGFFHTVSGLSGGNPPAKKPWGKHVFESVTTSTRTITVQVLNKPDAKISLTPRSGYSDSLILHFDNRVLERWRKKSGQSYRPVTRNERF